VQVDWGDGDYGRIAAALAPAADLLVARARVAAGDRVLDVACGTGNAALAAARRGAIVTGVDASAGLVARAARRLGDEGLAADFRTGQAEDLPVGDAEFDVVLSVFGVIFSADPPRAAAELVRVARPDGVIALTAWVPEGAVAAAGGILWGAVSGRRYGRTPWAAPGSLQELLEAAGMRDVAIEEDALAFTGPSPQGWLREQEDHHPVWRAARRTLGDGYAAVHDDMLRVLAEGNEDPCAFRVTSRYWAVRARR